MPAFKYNAWYSAVLAHTNALMVDQISRPLINAADLSNESTVGNVIPANLGVKSPHVAAWPEGVVLNMEPVTCTWGPFATVENLLRGPYFTAGKLTVRSHDQVTIGLPLVT